MTQYYQNIIEFIPRLIWVVSSSCYFNKMICLILFISFLVSYLIGSIPTGYWFAKYFFNTDITERGSGNIGASNIGRVLGKKYFALVFLIDFLKAFLALYVIGMIAGWVEFEHAYTQKILIFNALALLLGNAYSVFLKFKGGKGVATTAGILACLFPFKLLLVFCGLWLLVLVITYKPVIASLFAAYISCAVYYFVFLDKTNNNLFYFLIFVCIWVTFRHIVNIQKMLKK